MIDPDPVLASSRFHVTVADFAAAQRKHLRWLARRGRTWASLLAFTVLGTMLFAATTPGWTPGVLTATAAGGLSLMIAWSLIVYAAMPLVAR